MKTLSRMLWIASVLGLLVNLLLLYWTLSSATFHVIGCGGGGCDGVLGSRWSRVFGVPVAALGAGIYLLVIASILRKWKSVAAGCYTALFGAAVWFIIVQMVMLKAFCPWCMSAHGLGLLIAITGIWSHPWDDAFKNGMQAGLCAAFILALSQLYGPVPAGYRIESGSPAHNRKLSYQGGHRSYDVLALPILGKADATHIMVEYFDYGCPACRTMGGHLEALVGKHPEKLAVLLLPVPLDRACNHALAANEKDHPGSCYMTRIALAVWLASPEAFPDIHRAFLSEPTLDEIAALKMAQSVVPEKELDLALKDPWIDQTIRAHIRDWLVLSKQTRNLPKLIIRDGRILHGLPSDQADFIRVMEHEFGL